MRAAVLTVSDRSYQGQRDDASGPLIAERLAGLGFRVEFREIVPDQVEPIAEKLRHWADTAQVELVLTTGGTGLAPRDVTPEATLSIQDRAVPGLSEWLRSATFAKTKFAVLSRGISAIRRGTLIVNLPGSPKAVGEYLDLLGPILPHALSQLRQTPDWGEAPEHR